MKALALPAVYCVLLGVAGCSVFVQADRSKVKDDMYVPTDSGVAPDVGDEDDGGSADAAAGDAALDAGAADGG